MTLVPPPSTSCCIFLLPDQSCTPSMSLSPFQGWSPPHQESFPVLLITSPSRFLLHHTSHHQDTPLFHTNANLLHRYFFSYTLPISYTPFPGRSFPKLRSSKLSLSSLLPISSLSRFLLSLAPPMFHADLLPIRIPLKLCSFNVLFFCFKQISSPSRFLISCTFPMIRSFLSCLSPPHQDSS